MNKTLLAELGRRHQQLLATITELPEPDCYRQYHPDLSPPAWHLGHCVFVDTYWLHDRVLGDNALTADLETLYFPELSPKARRAERLPDKAALLEWAQGSFRDNRELLARLLHHPGGPHADHPLLQGAYLAHFLLQHHCQHLETLQQILQQRAFGLTWEAGDTTPLVSTDYLAPRATVGAGESEFGCPAIEIAYDNERPLWRTGVGDFAIAQRPVNNSEWLGFIEASGYRRREWWNGTGWHWREATKIDAPDHWRQARDGAWFSLTATGPQTLDPDGTLYGISHFEAEAFCRYAGGRLPHELEWERAAGLGVCTIERAWEWCSNPFFPYPGYRPYPYDGYSQPWFDGNHYSLRGASLHTLSPVRRPSFRNFYTPEKRHVFAGIRVAFDG